MIDQSLGTLSERALLNMRRMCELAAYLAIAVGALVLLGWLVSSPLLKGAIGSPITMKANAALCFLLSGGCLLLKARPGLLPSRAGTVMAAAVAVIGGLTLAQHLTGWSFGIDQLLFTEPPGQAATVSPGRMGPPASSSFLLLGTSLLFFDYRTSGGHRPFRYVPLAVAVISLVSIVGYAYNLPGLYSDAAVTGIAWPTAGSLFALSLGALAARPDTALMRVLAASNVGGMAARQLLVPSIAIPFALLFVYDASRDGNLIEANFARGLLAVAMMIALATVVLLTAYRLGVVAHSRARAEIEGRRLSAIVESSNDAIIGKDLEGIVTSWNRAAERMFGYSAAEMLGQPMLKLVPTDLAHEEIEILERLRNGQAIELFETVRQRKNGQRIDVSVSISPILDYDGRVAGGSHIARDVTERKRIEAEREALLESEREARAVAEQAARSRDEFLALVSHELRTPLNGILGWAQYLSVYFTKHAPDAAVADGVDAIERGGRALAKLIEDLLDMNRITSGRLALDVSAVHLYKVVESALATLRQAAESKQIALRTVLDSGMGPVIGDTTRLQQVVWNLVSNAVKFTPKGGAVDVVLRRTDSHAELCVHDTGMGVSPEFLPHMFDRFRQADESITRTHGGLGLGLAIVKHLVELHGGTVTAESAGAAQGSTFIVKLPLAAVRQDAASSDVSTAPEQPHREIDLTGVTVLVVDDDPEARELIRRVLSQSKAVVFVAASAADALEVLAREKLDVLVSDIGMPDVDGYQLIRTVREQLKLDGTELPAVAVTAYARSQDRTRAMLAGYQMHIAKPIEPQELLATVANFAGRTSPREPADAAVALRRTLR